MRFSSPGGFVSALQKNKIDKIWPTEEHGDDKGTWNLEYLAFFARPLDDSEIQVKFYDITQGKKYVAGDPQYTRERGSRIFGSSIELAKPEFDVRKHYKMTIESQGARHRHHHLLAARQGRQLQRQGRVLRRRHARQETRTTGDDGAGGVMR